jgi:two-component system sensor histidine kinase AlgZ
MIGLKKVWLTDFCQSLHVFVSIVIIQIVAFIYALSFLSFDVDFLQKLSILTLIAQFLGLNLLIILCKLRSFFNSLNVITGVSFLIITVIAITTLLTQIIGYLDTQLTFNLFLNQEAINYLNFKLSITSVIIILAMIRYFYIQDQWNKQIQKLSEARLNALQARIKPHFLFNSLNSISSLIAIDADRAELAISDFSNLMRQTFTHKEKLITINEELDWVNQYLSIEKLRLDKRLQYQVTCDEKLIHTKIPILCIQPLVENAILHGIQPLEEGGKIVINIYQHDNNLIITVNNPYISVKNHGSNGNGIALANIRERLQLHYGDKATMKRKTDNGVFNIQLSIPL